MRRFIITSKLFTGQVSIVYNDAGIIGRVDFIEADEMDLPVRLSIIKRIVNNPLLQDAEKLVEGTQAIMVESEFDVPFNYFWAEYPYKRNKHLAEDRWAKMTTADKIKAWKAAKEYKRYCMRNKWYNAQIADTWLNNREYLNEWNGL